MELHCVASHNIVSVCVRMFNFTKSVNTKHSQFGHITLRMLLRKLIGTGTKRGEEMSVSNHLGEGCYLCPRHGCCVPP